MHVCIYVSNTLAMSWRCVRAMGFEFCVSSHFMTVRVRVEDPLARAQALELIDMVHEVKEAVLLESESEASGM